MWGCLLSSVIPICTEGDVRLVDGGIVQLCYSNQWTVICSSEWSYNEASVSCKQLGYSSKGIINVNSYSKVYDILGAIVLHVMMTTSVNLIKYAISCNGSETSLLQCVNTANISTCQMAQYGGIKCRGKLNIIDLMISFP